MGLRVDTIRIQGMHCTSCEGTVKKAVGRLPGVDSVIADYRSGTVIVRYDPAVCTGDAVRKAIIGSGYDLKSAGLSQLLGVVIVVAAVVLLGRNGGIDINARLAGGATTLVLFMVGMLTSLHCAGMCGGILLSQTLADKPCGHLQALKPALLHNLGRVISYTVLGGIVGAIGSVFSISPIVKAALMLFAGLFMTVAGTNMAGLSIFRRFRTHLPLPGNKLGQRLGTGTNSPLVVGLLNGLMPCGPLQTMQLYALGTGSAIKGASAMFIFALGTVPVMLLLGVLSALLSKGFTQRVARISGVLVIGLGITMVGRGLTLAGIRLPQLPSLIARSAAASEQTTKAVVEDGVQTISMVADSRGYLPNLLYVQRGIPLKWVIDGKQVNSCNGQIIIPSLNITRDLKAGENVIEFTPEDDDIRFSCWMGMISGLMRVVDDLGTIDVTNPDTAPPPAGGGSCCAGGAGGTAGAPRTSIYGSDITKMPTERLVKKAVIRGTSQTAAFKGTGWELEPLIVVVQNNLRLTLTLDLSDADAPNGAYQIISIEANEQVATVRGSKGVVTAELKLPDSGGYVLVKDNEVIGVIESVSDLARADLQALRERYVAGGK